MTTSNVGHARGLLVIERILRDREGLWNQVRDERQLKTLIGQMLASAALALACYGAVLGAQGSGWQVLSSAVKLPILFLATLAICLPTLYLFNLVLGARLSLWQATTLMLAAVTVTGVLSLAFAPITLFFLVTSSNYEFYKLLNVAVLMLTGIVGLSVLLDGMRSLNKSPAAGSAGTPSGVAPQPAEPAMASAQPARAAATGATEAAAQPTAVAVADGHVDRPLGATRSYGESWPARPSEPRVNMTLLRIWVLLFGFVGTQLAWTLRPFVGHPDQEFQLFREGKIQGNFYVNVVQTIGELFN